MFQREGGRALSNNRSWIRLATTPTLLTLLTLPSCGQLQRCRFDQGRRYVGTWPPWDALCRRETIEKLSSWNAFVADLVTMPTVAGDPMSLAIMRLQGYFQGVPAVSSSALHLSPAHCRIRFGGGFFTGGMPIAPGRARTHNKALTDNADRIDPQNPPTYHIA